MFRHHFASFGNIIEMCKISACQRNLSTIFLKVINNYLILNIFQKVTIVMLRWNISRYLMKMLRQYFNCNEILDIFLTCFCNIQLCHWAFFLVISNRALEKWSKRFEVKCCYWAFSWKMYFLNSIKSKFNTSKDPWSSINQHQNF